MARHHTSASPSDVRGVNGTYATSLPHRVDTIPAAAPAAPPPAIEDVKATDTIELVTERVLARLVPELTENLRRLVREEIARQR
jgi:hypothetical protein